jgi:putative tricarboxylic transport membrane protein
LTNSSVELIILLISGVLGYFLRKLKYDIAPFVLAIIIGPLLGVFSTISHEERGSFSIFEKPIALTFLLIACALLFWNIFRSLKPAQQTGIPTHPEGGE